jgi:4-amino-4-deoxy-L-arabinose transferase-like glycosyltransferase
LKVLYENKNLSIVLIGLIAALVFIPMIGNCPLFDWDEVNFAECAREMVVSADYSHVQLNYRPFWEKPPFFIWLQAISMNIFGVNEFAARFPNAVCSIVTFIGLFVIGRKFHSSRFGLTWCGLYMASLLPHFYFKTGIIDPWFNLFIFLAVYKCHRFMNTARAGIVSAQAVFAGFFLGMAVLTKGPAALVIIAFTLLGYIVWSRQPLQLLSKNFWVFVLTTLIVSGSWFFIEWVKGNGQIITEFIEYQRRLAETQDSGHGGPFYYHFLVLLLGCFPSSVIFIATYMRYSDLTPFQRHLRKLFLCLFWSVLILFSIIETKIVHYSSLCYFPITFVAALGLSERPEEISFGKTSRWIFIVCSSLIGLASMVIGLFPFFRNYILEKGLIADEFAVQNLKAEVSWTGFEWLIGIVFLAGAYLIYQGLKNSNSKTLVSGLAINLLFITLTIYLIVPKVELYTQRSAIGFYKACAQHDCEIETHGFKSYAYLFYSNRKPSDYSNAEQKRFIEQQLNLMVSEGHSRIMSYAVANQLWMEYGTIHRPAYIVIKTTSEKELLGIKDMSKLYDLNGYSFFVRMPGTRPRN